MEETKGKIQKEASEVLDQCPLLDRIKCFETVAAGVKDIVPDSVVDLKSPEVVYIYRKEFKPCCIISFIYKV